MEAVALPVKLCKEINKMLAVHLMARKNRPHFFATDLVLLLTLRCRNLSLSAKIPNNYLC